MEFIEKHIEKVTTLLNNENGLYYNLEKVAEYLLSTNDLSAIAIFRRTGDELDDYVFKSGGRSLFPSLSAATKTHIHSMKRLKSVTIIPSASAKSIHSKKHKKIGPELTVPIARVDTVVGVLQAEKRVGTYFSPTDIRILKESANVIARQFVPSVLSA